MLVGPIYSGGKIFQKFPTAYKNPSMEVIQNGTKSSVCGDRAA
jgi:hypothetical protein